MPFSTYLADKMGSATLSPPGPFVAGSYAELTLTYTAGPFGIDDTGGLKLSFKTTTDMAPPQFTDPAGPNYTTVVAGNGAVLRCVYDRINIRPWVYTLYIRVLSGFMRPGDTITIKLGDRSHGSPGLRLQTNVETEFHCKVFVDAFATYDFCEMPGSPTYRLVPGPVHRWRALLPTLREVGQKFRLAVAALDLWGNPTPRADSALALRPSLDVKGLPLSLSAKPGDGPWILDELSVASPGDLTVDVIADGQIVATSNPLRIVAHAPLVHFWSDFHGQSGETVGSNSAREYFEFARDRAFLDIVGHQGNDFQITDAFWDELNRLTQEFNRPGHFVTIPGYEWSGNTGVGGDRNVFFADEGRVIHRSSHALIDADEGNTACHTATDLFQALIDQDAVAFAHVGGRYADVGVGHDGRIERAMEIHSTWGTFEWLLHDALNLGHRVGVVCNSDDHKGRPGMTSPGASMFGAIGGLTCLWMPELTRKAVFQALRKRHCYGTTGTRIYLDVRARFSRPATLYDDDPKLGPTPSRLGDRAMMGDIVRVADDHATLFVDAVGSAPIERLTIFNGTEAIDIVRPYAERDLGSRIRVIWEGAEYRGRGRQVTWDGRATLLGNRFSRAEPVNFLNPERKLIANGDRELAWSSVTTGNLAGFDLWLDDPNAGELAIETRPAKARVRIADVGLRDTVVDAGGLDRRLRLFRLPDSNPHRALTAERSIGLKAEGDNPIYVRVTQEDGHQAWSSPIYLFR
jgi:hypothetical protein